MKQIALIGLIFLAVCCKTKKESEVKLPTPFQTSLNRFIEHKKSMVDAYSDSASFCKAEKLLYYGEQMEMASDELRKLQQWKP